jgi:hypothetical protein
MRDSPDTPGALVAAKPDGDIERESPIEMSLTPTLLTAALAGIFSGVMWRLIWPLSTMWLMLGTIVLVVLPAHAFVMGFKRRQSAGSGAMDLALLARVGAWVACAAGASFLVSVFRAAA